MYFAGEGRMENCNFSKAAAWAWYVRNNPYEASFKLPPSSSSSSSPCGISRGFSRFRPYDYDMKHQSAPHKLLSSDAIIKVEAKYFNNEKSFEDYMSEDVRCQQTFRVPRCHFQCNSCKTDRNLSEDVINITSWNSALLDSFEMKHLISYLQGTAGIQATLHQYDEGMKKYSALFHPNVTNGRKDIPSCMNILTLYYSPCQIAILQLFRRIKCMIKLLQNSKKLSSS
ncbi:hypothetical protein KP509_06G030000 [Ceratopteris richardii]|uniref:Uncharacterized protein n=1 Tax=Ceratopteris richardii TaxID=49495 RepID=A0A8T2UMD5_CERRI|nr:hypothetical protein KP509_06G030000 [Ceratopteris richardii]